MRCPYIKTTKNGQFQLGKGYIQDVEEYPECHGDECPLFNAKLIPPCMRAVAERNKAYILVKREETFKGPWGN